ncbi:MAG: helix-turn-helix transcriptional regulator [Bauldia sp.]
MAQMNPIDVHVGARLRLLRVKAKLSQQAIGKMLGLTFQQIQKYEKGTNRISASKLFELAGILDCSVQDFFAGLEETGGSRAQTHNPSRLDYEILVLLGRVPDNNLKRQIRGLLEAMMAHGVGQGQGHQGASTQ